MTRMENREQILIELQEIAPVLGHYGIMSIPYSVQTGYFTSFAEILMIRIRLESADYSENPDLEITKISPLLSGLRQKETYQAPPEFFQNLQVRIPATEITPWVLKAVPGFKLNSGKRQRSVPMRLFRYATAACIVALIGIAGFDITHHRNITDPVMGLTAVSDQEMATYLDDDDIHWTPGVTSAAETASVDFNDDDIHDLLKGVPDVELEQYSLALPEQKGTVN